jgi:hypothetical protein
VSKTETKPEPKRESTIEKKVTPTFKVESLGQWLGGKKNKHETGKTPHK